MEKLQPENYTDKTQDVSQKIALDLPPEKAVTDYFKTKYDERLLVK